MKATLTALHKDSGASYSETLNFDNKDQFLESYNEFKDNVPFSRWYVEVDADDNTDLVESWLED